MPRTEKKQTSAKTTRRGKGPEANQRQAKAPAAKQQRGRTAEKTRKQAAPAKRGPRGGKKAEMVSKTTRRAKWIESVDDHEDRHGQTLATQNHDVIQRWAEERGAKPVTVPGTEHEGRAGVLRFDFPGFGGRELQELSWNDWFDTFDHRGLVFLFQEHKRNGVQSNFFRLDNPSREDA